jgi:hypothetical protein
MYLHSAIPVPRTLPVPSVFPCTLCSALRVPCAVRGPGGLFQHRNPGTQGALGTHRVPALRVPCARRGPGGLFNPDTYHSSCDHIWALPVIPNADRSQSRTSSVCDGSRATARHHPRYQTLSAIRHWLIEFYFQLGILLPPRTFCRFYYLCLRTLYYHGFILDSSLRVFQPQLVGIET